MKFLILSTLIVGDNNLLCRAYRSTRQLKTGLLVHMFKTVFLVHMCTRQLKTGLLVHMSTRQLKTDLLVYVLRHI